MKLKFYFLNVIFLFLLFGCDKGNKNDISQSKSEEVQWTSGFGQGTNEYFVDNGPGNRIYIACNESRPASISVELLGKEPDESLGEKTVFIIDSVAYPGAHENQDCNVCNDNFENFWEKLRNAKTLSVKFSDNKVSTFSTNKLKEKLPSLNDKDTSCTVNR